MIEARKARVRAAWVVAAWLSAIVLAVAFADRGLSSWSHETLRRPQWCVWLTWIANLPAPLAVLGLGGMGAAWLAGWQPGPVARLALAVCVATLVADAAKDVLKIAFGRPWPETWVNHNPSWIADRAYGFHPFHGGQGWASFPSGHAASITAPCAVLWRALPRLWPAWLLALVLVIIGLMPVLVIIGLIGADYHFLGDCLAGAGVGVLAARVVRLA